MEGTAQIAQVTEVIGSQNISYMAGEICIALLLPLAAAVIWKKKKQVELMPIFAGACVYFAFLIVGRQLLDMLFLGMSPAVGEAISGSAWMGVAYSALLTGILHGAGSFVCFKVVLSDDKAKTTPISYGIGYGGLECMYVLGYTVIGYFVLALQLNGVGMEAVMEAIGTQDPTPYMATIDTINAISLSTVLLAGYERIMFMIFQISLSVLIFTAVHYKSRAVWFPIAVLLHIGLEVIIGFGSLGLVLSLPVAEVLLFVYVAVTAFLAFRQYLCLPQK